MCHLPAQVVATACPFCDLLFRQVGEHIPRCRERNGREYSAYLGRNSKMTVSRRKRCHKCQRFFVRLDTHLRTCKRDLSRLRTANSRGRLYASNVIGSAGSTVTNRRPPTVEPPTHITLSSQVRRYFLIPVYLSFSPI